MSACLVAALAYAARGWRVLPVAGKIPTLKDWPANATTDPESIRLWWAQQPTANVGIATGKQSHLFVLDVDPGNGGDDALRQLEAQYGPLPATIEVLTGGGGHHYYFQHPTIALGNSAGKLGAGLDIRTDGGQVVAPPSVHPNTQRTYEWEISAHPDDMPLAQVPAWLLEKLTAKTDRTHPSSSGETIPAGQRNAALTSLAGSMRRRGMGQASIEAALRIENAARCQPPLSGAEVSAVVASVSRYTPAQADNSFQASRPGGLPETHFKPVRASDLLNEVQEPTEWVLEDFLPVGSLALLAGKPKEGKTTLAYELAAKVAQGQSFLGRTTQKGGVLIVAVEEHRRDVKARLANLGAEGIENLYVHVGPLKPTPTFFAMLTTFIQDHEIRLVIVDTLAAFWSVQNENDASEMTKAVKPLLQLARESDACVLLIHHARKSEGSHGDEIRGSGALFGLVDIAVVMKRHSVETQRLLQAQSRFPETPSELVVELREHGYVALGDPAAVGKADKLKRLHAALTETPEEIESLAKKAGLSKRDATRLLDLQWRAGEAIREGKGKKSDPYRFARFVAGNPPGLIARNEFNPTAGLPDSLLATPSSAVPPARNETRDDEVLDLDL
jgi:hypothetical protein